MLTTDQLQKPFDIRPCHGCTLDDLVMDLFSVSYLPAAVDREVIAENQREVPEQMASLRLYDLASDCPTNAVALLYPARANDDVNCLATLKHYRSLMPMAQEARKPIFHLKAADGALGGHIYAVQDCYDDFMRLALAIADRCGVPL
ncbi:MAG: hypothetical protein OXH96_17535 [Spirochaetaceae bacterium]|nr:hypothetical protein [Spirochaetaceae bacterium]